MRFFHRWRSKLLLSFYSRQCIAKSTGIFATRKTGSNRYGQAVWAWNGSAAKFDFSGGTSAGCAIIGEFIFSAEKDYPYDSSQPVLDNPYDYHVTIRRSLLATPYFDSIITDTHYSQRDRHGRQVVFMARMSTDSGVQLPVLFKLRNFYFLLLNNMGSGWNWNRSRNGDFC